jgi:3-methyladenine DNA glycosylase Tag
VINANNYLGILQWSVLLVENHTELCKLQTILSHNIVSSVTRHERKVYSGFSFDRILGYSGLSLDRFIQDSGLFRVQF